MQQRYGRQRLVCHASQQRGNMREKRRENREATINGQVIS